MTTQEKIASTAPCGLDCFNCNSHEANITPEYRARMSQFFGIPPEQAVCRGGCRAIKGNCLYTGGPCETYNCAERKGVEYCFECDEFPCTRLAPSKDSAMKGYPHNFKLFNLCRMRAVGVESWIENEADTIRNMYYNGRFVVGDRPVIDEPAGCGTAGGGAASNGTAGNGAAGGGAASSGTAGDGTAGSGRVTNGKSAK